MDTVVISNPRNYPKRVISLIRGSRPLDCTFKLNSFCLFPWGLSSHVRVFPSYSDVTITGEGLQILTCDHLFRKASTLKINSNSNFSWLIEFSEMSELNSDFTIKLLCTTTEIHLTYKKNHKKSHCFYELFKKTLLESSVDWCCIIQYQKANELILITSKSGKQKDKYTMMPTKNKKLTWMKTEINSLRDKYVSKITNYEQKCMCLI